MKNKDKKNLWDKILSGEKIITDKEAKIKEIEVRKLRKEWGFRN